MDDEKENGVKPIEQRFWQKVAKLPSGCWEWTGARSAKGYGRFGYQGKNRHAHQIAYILMHGEIPAGLWILHRCDNTPCVNPVHLYAGTPSQNTQDAYDRGRKKPPCLRGEAHSMAKLTSDAVTKLRSGALSTREAVAKYGISLRNAQAAKPKIRQRRTRANLD